MLTRLVAAAAALLLVAGCSGGGDGDSGGDPAALAQRLETAQQAIFDAEALDISLSTKQVPDGITGLVSATGYGYQGDDTRSAGFEGDVKVVSGGSQISAEIGSTGGKTIAKTSIAPVALEIDPATIGAPDPAELLGKKGEGVATILTETEKLSEGKKTRDGSTVLTTITGELPGSVVKKFLPTALESGTFTVSYRLTDDDTLQDATIKGRFYEKSDSNVTYTLTLTPTAFDGDVSFPK